MAHARTVRLYRTFRWIHGRFFDGVEKIQDVACERQYNELGETTCVTPPRARRRDDAKR